jgi:hypothetical protein
LTNSFKEDDLKSMEMMRKGTFRDDDKGDKKLSNLNDNISDNISMRSDKSSLLQEKQGSKKEDEDQFSDMDEQDEFLEQN